MQAESAPIIRGDEMKRILKGIGVALWCVLVVGGSVEEGSASTETQSRPVITLGEFVPLHTIERVLVLDVRDAESFGRGHIPRASHVPLREVESQVDDIRTLAKGRLVVTYCSCPTEATSLMAARLLNAAGISSKALVGGFQGWVESGGAIAIRGVWPRGTR